MLHKRRLGKEGLAVLRRFENATQSNWDMTLDDRDTQTGVRVRGAEEEEREASQPEFSLVRCTVCAAWNARQLGMWFPNRVAGWGLGGSKGHG